jgi:hypothetical protein
MAGDVVAELFGLENIITLKQLISHTDVIWIASL